MVQNGILQVARPGQPSRQMTLSEINLALASGEVLPEDQYWARGMPRWEIVRGLPGAILPPSPRTRPPMQTDGSRPPHVTHDHIAVQRAMAAATPQDNLSFWAQPESKPRLAVWSPVTYTLLSVFFSPLAGTILIAQNHRATQETIWRGIAWFWIVVWGVFLAGGLFLHAMSVPCGPLAAWGAALAALTACWFFTCALPHRGYLHTRSFDAAWRSDWGKPVGVGFLVWVLVVTALLFSH